MQSSTVAAQMEREVKLGALQEASKLIHLLYHRNKNQHHHALWWKWLSMLQRSVAKLTRALEEKRREQATTRMKHMRDVLLPGCYLSFTHMVADSQFSALGLVLLSELAKVARIIRPSTYAVCAREGTSPASGVEGQSRDAEYLEDVGEAMPRRSTSKRFTGKLEFNIADRGNLLDTGETGQTASGAAMPKTQDLNQHSASSEASTQVPSSWTRRQKRKGMNAIDDLFSGLD
ncbi:hypothetical protein LPUS_05131 [Lasallia pustulata]|uniref:RNase MRP protein 1 RNA binding domain-containing protein n=1 Tax=Lasallia pustulata TaxID=136370 RepID=A0A1W5CYF6_9LECA|nr:hypothetical protein LPUS_05131 [Lasallia pustulata]